MTNKEIKCPNCGIPIKIDESLYDSIVKQIKDKEFKSELEKQKDEAIRLVRIETEAELKEELSKKESLIKELEYKLSKKDDDIKLQINSVKADNELKLAKKESELKDLKAELKSKDTEKELEISKIQSNNEKELNDLKNKINVLNQTHDYELKAKQEEVEFYKDFKAKQSTKAIGEDLEQYCYNQFNKLLRPILPNAYFEKDNEVSKESGSKGDFIFKDIEDGIEIVSCMIECKNEADTTAKKHKNDDFLKELDKDRNEKKCEYAILVSTLEADNDLYNDGIVDVTYKYPKMYVVRPQQFIPLITLLRSTSLKSLDYKKALVVAQNQNIDITNFESNINEVKSQIKRNYELASDRFKDAIDHIDKTIKELEKTKENLLKSEKNFKIANDKAEGLSIKKLTHNAPSVEKMFEEGKK